MSVSRRAQSAILARKLKRARVLSERLAVKFGPPVAEEAPRGAVRFEEVQIEFVDQHALILPVETLDQIATMIGDEG
jgi:hypothetical protein